MVKNIRASDLMDKFYNAGKQARASENYEYAQTMNSVENIVNNLHHGKPSNEWLPVLHKIIKELSEQYSNDPAYNDALVIMEDYL